MSQLRNEIRAETKARREAGPRWGNWLSLGTGAVGALTGLASVLLK